MLLYNYMITTKLLDKSDQIFEEIIISIVKLSREENIEKRLKIKEILADKLNKVVLIEDRDFLKLAVELNK